MSGITKTIPATEGRAAVDALYTIPGEYEFHMAGKPSKLQVGDYVYTFNSTSLEGKGMASDFALEMLELKLV